jgi:uncharacterized protein
MDVGALIGNLNDPAVLFFFLGVLATLVKSDLEVPPPVTRFLSLYLLMSIGFKGGAELSGHATGLWPLLPPVLLSALIPVGVFFLLYKRVGAANAAALGAAYGSVSAVTFITAVSFLEKTGISYSGHMVAGLALMESPAILTGLMLYQWFGQKESTALRVPLKQMALEALLNGSVFLILGAMLVGMLAGETAKAQMAPFTKDIFKGMLALFMLDMGIVAARRFDALRKGGLVLVLFALVVPLIFGHLGLVLAGLMNVAPGDALLMAILCGSASYIAVPAAMRSAIPDADPGLYVPLPLAVTFPLNVLVGIPLYYAMYPWFNQIFNP